MNPRERVTDRLQLYGLYQIRYVQPKPRPEPRTVRALFLGETKKLEEHALTDLADHPGGREVPIGDRYLDVAFMTYRPGTGIPSSAPASRYAVFRIFYCNPSGLAQLSEGDVVVLPAGYHAKQFVEVPDGPHRELLQKLRSIGENSGLIDVRLERIGRKASNPLTKTRIRELHRGFTQMIEKTEPDAGAADD